MLMVTPGWIHGIKVMNTKLDFTTEKTRTRLNHMLSGLRPWWWHACNVALHAACCVLVARACVTVARLKRPFAALAALLFAVHPVHTEAVAGVVGRADVLACIFFLSSLLVYHRSSLLPIALVFQSLFNIVERPTSNKKCVWMSIVLGALSMLAKETGVTVLLLNLAFDFYRCWPFLRRSICSLKIEKKCTGLTIRSMKVLTSLALLVCLRLALLQGTWPTFSVQDNPAAFHPSFFVRLMTFCYLAAFNWWLLLCPWTLSHDWQMGSVPLVQRHTPAVVGMLLLVVPFVPASNLLVTVGFVIAERVLYIPSVGSVIITAYGVQLMWYSKPGTKTYLVVGLAMLATSGVAKTYRRNADWRDRATLLKADLVNLPQNAKLHYNFANFLRETEQQDGAIKHYKEALRLWPSYASAHNNMGTLISRLENAEYHFLQALKFNKYHVNAHYNLGKLYKKTGRTLNAISMLEKCIWIQPRFVQAHLELLTLKPKSDQHRTLATLVELEPTNWEHFVLYGDWWRERGFPGPASRFYLEATRLNFKHRFVDRPLRGDLVSLRYTALMYRALGQKSRALQLLTRWHTWRRGWPSAAAAHMYLRDWRLKLELEGRVQIYSKAVNPKKSTKCFDHSQLAVESKPKDKTKPKDEKIVTKSDKKLKINSCVCKNCGTKKRDVSISSQLKTIHNKSETGHKEKECTLRKKQTESEIPNIPLAEHILMKTF
ncbi:Uncharacterized protein OBRU01_01878 [Operophtera brumata]|uniref:dolichyl-phosphate-mannose--protein mannosyltransferase n=1 Tax=Operophtera brumata TaxID=104452 RepID=A0A0L7LR60_OPEBR|nr:Uncharacterized protein OBRU01_01878 [Operophtera brumata]